MLPLRSVGRSNFDKGLHNLTALIQKRNMLMRTAVIHIYILLGLHLLPHVVTQCFTYANDDDDLQTGAEDGWVRFL